MEKHTWAGFAKQIGTNEQMYETGRSQEEVRRKLFGQAYGPIRDTVQYVRINQGAN